MVILLLIAAAVSVVILAELGAPDGRDDGTAIDGRQERPRIVPSKGPVTAPQKVALPQPANHQDHSLENELPRRLRDLADASPKTRFIAWTDEPVPDVFSRVGFQSAATAALESCEARSALVGTDCEEAPCVVAISSVQPFNPERCPEWLALFGDSVLTNLAIDVDCPDGRTVKAALVAPHAAADLSVPEDRRDDVKYRLVERAMQFSVDEWCSSAL